MRSDKLAALGATGKTQHHAARVTPPDKAGEWLPWVHVAIGNLKAFLLGTYHGVSSKHLQEYLNESAIASTVAPGNPNSPCACLTLA